MLKTLVLVLLYVFIFVLLIDPSDIIFHLKIPLFAAVLLCWFVQKFRKNNIRLQKGSVYFIGVYLLIIIIGITSAVLQDNVNNIPFATGFIKSALLLFIIFIADDLDIRVDKILIHTSIVLPILTVYIFFIFIKDPIYFNNVIYPYFDDDTSTAILAPRNYYGFEIAMFFFKTSPLLVFPLGYYAHQLMNKKKKFLNFVLMLIFFFTMFLSGTRANILSAFLIVVIIVLIKLYYMANKFPLIIASVILISFLTLFLFKASFDEKELSQEIKSEHVESYKTLFTDHPQYLLFGQGIGAEFYSKGFGKLTPQTELTYIDVIRMFGLPLGLGFILLNFYPIIYLIRTRNFNKENISHIIVFASYLFIAGTNPLLISSTGMLAIISIFGVINFVKNKEELLFNNK